MWCAVFLSKGVNAKDLPQMNANKHEWFVCAPVANYTIYIFCFYWRELAFICGKYFAYSK